MITLTRLLLLSAVILFLNDSFAGDVIEFSARKNEPTGQATPKTAEPHATGQVHELPSCRLILKGKDPWVMPAPSEDYVRGDANEPKLADIYKQLEFGLNQAQSEELKRFMALMKYGLADDRVRNSISALDESMTPDQRVFFKMFLSRVYRPI